MIIILVAFILCFSSVNGESEYDEETETKFYAAENAIPNRYIVVLKTDSDRDGLSLLTNKDLQKQQKVLSTYAVDDFVGYSAILTEKGKRKLLDDPRVAFIEQDAIISISGYNCSSKEMTDEYFLPIISQRNSSIYYDQANVNVFGSRPIQKYIYHYMDESGTGVNAYILDSGVLVNHTEFSDKPIAVGPNFVTNEDLNDNHGHGTCVAGILAGKQYGVAKNVSLISVKILNSEGLGTTSIIISAINWVVADIRGGKKIINLSINGQRSKALNTAIKAASERNVAVFVAAGNAAGNVKHFSPSSEKTAITVAAASSVYRIAPFSNYGKLVDLFAPGVQIKCASNNDADEFVYKSGTSMASPLVAGVAAIILGATTIEKPSVLESELKNISKVNLIKGLNGPRKETPNLFLFNGCD